MMSEVVFKTCEKNHNMVHCLVLQSKVHPHSRTHDHEKVSKRSYGRYQSHMIKKVLGVVLMMIQIWNIGGQKEMNFDAVVALNGGGDFTKISDAISAAPAHSTKKHYIKIKAGVYHEHVRIGKAKKNLVLVGDGMDVTIITSERSNKTGWNINESATVDVEGDYFTAKYITFRNSAGPSGGQAVALRCNSNFSAFYKCGFQGYQDTLFVAKGIQFYRESNIYGTVDFIFGDAKVVFQSCGIYVRNPGKGFSNVVTAQERSSLVDDSGICLQNCMIKADKSFNPKSGTKTFLGRPWGQYSTVVIMQSFLDNLIDPKGWTPWRNNPSTLKTTFYGEYKNRGPGARTNQRTRKGFRTLDSSEAEGFTIRKFLQGEKWIPQTGIPFTLDLM